MRCVFCRTEQSPSPEHVIPKALGAGFVITRVCTRCNSTLGTRADAALVNHPLIVMQRARLGIKNRYGIVPEVFKEVLGTGHLTSDPGQRAQVSFPGSGQRPEVRLLYQRTSTTTPDGQGSVRIMIDADEASQVPKIVEKERARAGLTSLTGEELNKEAKRILSECRGTIERPEITYRLEIDLVEFRRGLLKIAYELAWHWLGDSYLADLQADKLRAMIAHPGPLTGYPSLNDAQGKLEWSDSMAPLDVWKKEPDVHLAFIQRSKGNIAVALRIFSAISSVIVVSNDGAAYPAFALGETLGRFLRIDPQTGTHRETSLLDELDAITDCGPQ